MAIDPFSATYRRKSSGTRTENHQLSPSRTSRVTRPTASTCPCTKCPPRRSPAARGRSRFTVAPAFLSPSPVRRKVSPDKSAAKKSSPSSTTVRQQPFTAMLSLIFSGVGAHGGPKFARSRPPSFVASSASILPTRSMIPVNIVKVSLDRKILAVLFHSLHPQLALSPRPSRRQDRQRNSAFADELGSIKENHLIDNPGFERGPIHARAGLDQHAENFPAPQFTNYFV